jgi:hypothetical protein
MRTVTGREVALFSMLASVASAQTRPLLTEEATTAPAGSLVLEAGFDAIRREPNFLTLRERDRWDGPVLRLVYSPADRVELDLEWTARVGVRDDPDFGNASDWGDVALRAKLRLVDGGRAGPTLAARFTVTLPETSFGNGLGPNTLRMSAQALVSRSWRALTAHANAGLAIQDEPLRAHEQRDFLAYGFALVRPLGGAEVVAEAAGLAGRGKPGADARSELRLGLRRRSGRWRWDAALRRGLAAADGTWGLTAGFSISRPPRAGP